MQSALVIDNKTYLPSTDLARRFSYTSDYIAKLSRDGKIDATKVGRKWYVYEVSLHEFVAAATVAKAERSDSLRQERKNERAQFSDWQLRSSDLTAVPDASVNIESRTPAVQSAQVVVVSMIQSALIVICGSLVGVLGFDVYESDVRPAEVVTALTSVSTEQLAFLDFADWWQRWFGKRVVVVDYEVTTSQGQSQQSSQAQVVIAPATHPQHSALLLLDQRTSTTTVADIKRSFSDEVEVDFDGPDTGVLRPVFRTQTDEAYRFLLVPVAEAGTI